MRGASFRDLACADLTVDNVKAMLKLNETLFVEHKAANQPSVRLARAVASFANQLGGWVLVTSPTTVTLGRRDHYRGG